MQTLDMVKPKELPLTAQLWSGLDYQSQRAVSQLASDIQGRRRQRHRQRVVQPTVMSKRPTTLA